MKCCIAFAAFTLLATAKSRTIRVNPGDDFETVCLHQVRPGDSCYLEKGKYYHDGLTVTHGTRERRITIGGHPEACIKGSNRQDRVFQVAHNFYTIKDISFNGKHGNDYVSTAIYVLGGDEKNTKDSYGIKSSVTGLQLFNLDIIDFNEECIHFRYFVTFAEVRGCSIQNCGHDDFGKSGGGKVGEAIYLGTAPDQVADNKTPEVKLRTGKADNVVIDVCQKNWIHRNTMRTNGNECVDVKEGSTKNLIENNVCERQRDSESGCFGARGSYNTFRYNDISDCNGSGFRLGGHGKYGTHNNVYSNNIEGAQRSAFNMMAEPQGLLCDNDISSDTIMIFSGKFKESYVAEDVTGRCPSGERPGDIPELTDPNFSDSTDGDSDSTDVDDDSTNGDDDGSTDGDDEGSTDDDSGEGDDDSGEGDDDSGEGDDDSGEGDDDNTDSTDVAVPIEKEKTDYKLCAGMDCVDLDDAESKTVEVTTNFNAGLKGLGGCSTVLSVSDVFVERFDKADSETSVNNLFDGDKKTYFSVKRDITSFTFVLKEESIIHGISIGFFMKEASEGRIQTFDLEVCSKVDKCDVVYDHRESDGSMKVQHFEFLTAAKAVAVKFKSFGNQYNRWTALNEFEVCGVQETESDALFSGVRAAKNEIAELAGGVCKNTTIVPATRVRSTSVHNVRNLFDDNYITRLSFQRTNSTNDLDNDRIMLQFKGEVSVSHVNILFFDGHLAPQRFRLYKEGSRDTTWTPMGEERVAGRNNLMQTFSVQETGVRTLSFVGHGNEVGLLNKIAEMQIHGC